MKAKLELRNSEWESESWYEITFIIIVHCMMEKLIVDGWLVQSKPREKSAVVDAWRLESVLPSFTEWNAE